MNVSYYLKTKAASSVINEKHAITQSAGKFSLFEDLRPDKQRICFYLIKELDRLIIKVSKASLKLNIVCTIQVGELTYIAATASKKDGFLIIAYPDGLELFVIPNGKDSIIDHCKRVIDGVYNDSLKWIRR